MAIRRATIEDIDELVTLRIGFLNEVNDQSQSPPGFAKKIKCYWRDSMMDGSFVSWVAVECDRIVATGGVCFYRIAPNYSNPSGKIAYILNMYTVPECRGRGLASAVFTELIGEARARGCGKAMLHATEAGRKVYEKFGFRLAEDGMTLKL